MTQFGKPLWSQGMFMRPQHFQQQERYWEAFVNDHVAGQSGYGWGCDGWRSTARRWSSGASR